MITDSITIAIKHELKQRIADESAYIASGKCADFADYKKHTGVLSGLELAITLVNDVAKRLQHDEDEDDDF